ncbi:hypothetical protein [Catenuloplanes indicus]|uniref:Uncharacterized protein n=1 Tax=Catenuloplanes indicus TaxID=137267 RepID=A0AAE4B1S0_9ACTN|nr:hypothetical protein [Catenuloplanes indicus]MDQ0370907.1 hypothetical protein [Catenuloplanes indicus]
MDGPLIAVGSRFPPLREPAVRTGFPAESRGTASSNRVTTHASSGGE